MIAVDTNVLIYAFDRADSRRQQIALDLVSSVENGVLLWQVACDHLGLTQAWQGGIHLDARLEFASPSSKHYYRSCFRPRAFWLARRSFISRAEQRSGTR